MGTETNEPEETVHDGVEAGSKHIPREPAEATAAPGGGTPDEGTPDEGEAQPDGSEANDPTGPAEEQDDKTPDNRGLTTDTSPTD